MAGCNEAVSAIIAGSTQDQGFARPCKEANCLGKRTPGPFHELGFAGSGFDGVPFGFGMFFAGAALGLLASQLGNVTMSAVSEKQTSEVGGLQGVSQNLGSSLGTALIGSLLIGALAHAFTSQVEDDPVLSREAKQQTSVALQAGISFVPTDQVRTATERAGLPPSEVDALADSYASAQLDGLKAAILATGGITLAAFPVTPRLPGGRTDGPAPATADRPKPPGKGRSVPRGTGTPAAPRRSAR